MNSHQTKSSRVPGLDVFRSAAIVLVLACHFSKCGLAEGRTADKWRVWLSLHGVELFFVLSGFLIGAILIRDSADGEMGGERLRRFWSRRWLRTLPNYYFYLLIAFALERPWRYEAGDWWRYPLFVQNFAGTVRRFFLVSWSLSVEEWFYLLFPVAIIVLSIRRLGGQEIKSLKSKVQGPEANIARGVLRAVVFFTVAPFLTRLLATLVLPEDSVGAPALSLCRLDAIAMGVLLALVKYRWEKVWAALAQMSVTAGGVGLTAALFVWVWFGGEQLTASPGLLDAVFYVLLNLACALLLPWFAEWWRLPEPALSFFTWLSVLSYSLYLCHLPVMQVADQVLLRLGWFDLGALRLAVWVVGSVAVAVVSYWLVERPFMQMRKREIGPKSEVQSPKS